MQKARTIRWMRRVMDHVLNIVTFEYITWREVNMIESKPHDTDAVKKRSSRGENEGIVN